MPRKPLPYALALLGWAMVAVQADAAPMPRSALQAATPLVLAGWFEDSRPAHEKLDDSIKEVQDSLNRLHSSVSRVETILSDTNSYTLDRALKEAEAYKAKLNEVIKKLSSGGSVQTLVQETQRWARSNKERVVNSSLSIERRRFLAEQWEAKIKEIHEVSRELEAVRAQLNSMYGKASQDTEWIAELLLLKKADTAIEAMRTLLQDMKGAIEVLERRPVHTLSPAPSS